MAKISFDAFEAEDATRDVCRNKDGAAECGRNLSPPVITYDSSSCPTYAFPFCFIHILDTIELDSGYGLRRLLCAIAVFFRSVASVGRK